MNLIDRLLDPLALVAALGSGLVAGVFFAFSTFVMKALTRIPASSGISAMQSINIVVINPVFMSAFVGTAALCVAIAIATVMRWDRPGSAYLLAGCALYVIGTFIVTIALNVPLNNALAGLTTTDPEAPVRWADYVSRWTMWNHVRTAAALAAAGAFTMALRS